MSRLGYDFTQPVKFTVAEEAAAATVEAEAEQQITKHQRRRRRLCCRVPCQWPWRRSSASIRAILHHRTKNDLVVGTGPPGPGPGHELESGPGLPCRPLLATSVEVMAETTDRDSSRKRDCNELFRKLHQCLPDDEKKRLKDYAVRTLKERPPTMNKREVIIFISRIC